MYTFVYPTYYTIYLENNLRMFLIDLLLDACIPAYLLAYRKALYCVHR